MSSEPPSSPSPANGFSPEAVPGARCELALANPGRYPEASARRLRPWLLRLLAALAPTAASFSVRFSSDRELRRLNLTFRGKDAPTDVLSFPGDRTAEGWHLGDVAISVPTARRQAAAAGHDPERELRLLVLHGVLHCLGYDHETDGGTMDRLETRLRRRFLDASP